MRILCPTLIFVSVFKYGPIHLCGGGGVGGRYRQAQGVSAHYKMYQTEKEMEEELRLGYVQAIVTQPSYSCCGVKRCVRSSLSGSVFTGVFFPP